MLNVQPSYYPPPQDELLPSTTRLATRQSLARSVPRGLATFFSCEDEDQEFFSNKYLHDLKVSGGAGEKRDMT